MAVSKKLGVGSAKQSNPSRVQPSRSTGSTSTTDQTANPKIARKTPKSSTAVQDGAEGNQEPLVESTSPTAVETTSPTIVETTSPTAGETTSPTIVETPSPLEGSQIPQATVPSVEPASEAVHESPDFAGRPKRKQPTKRVTFADGASPGGPPISKSRRSPRKIPSQATRDALNSQLEVQQAQILNETLAAARNNTNTNSELLSPYRNLSSEQLVQELTMIEKWAMELKHQLHDISLAKQNIIALQYGYATRENFLTAELEKLNMKRSRLLGVRPYQRENERSISDMENDDDSA